MPPERSAMSTTTDAAGEQTVTTTVDVKATGHVRRELGEHRFDYTFEGDTLREFLDALFAEHPELKEMLVAETEAEASTEGWVDIDDLPGDWAKNPEGEQTRPYVRVVVNGTFNEHLDGFDTELDDGDRVALMFPFMFCC
jgi:molybdopterin converting factor small subunit